MGEDERMALSILLHYNRNKTSFFVSLGYFFEIVKRVDREKLSNFF